MLGLLLLALHVAAPPEDPPAPARGQPLRIATASVAPFVLPDSDPPAGFSVDVWNEVARRLQIEFTWSRVPIAELIPAVQRGEADVAIAAITMTPEREQLVDFAYPYFDSGLQIMVRVGHDSRLVELLESFPWPTLGELLVVSLVIVLLLAHVLWLIERRVNPLFKKPYIRGIGEGLWGALLIVATGEHGDRETPRIVKRLAVAAMWLLGVVVLAQLTATVTSSQTVARLQSAVHGPEDLPGLKIGTVPGTVAEEYLNRKRLPHVALTSADDGLTKLMQGELQAIVFDAPTLRYWAARRGNGRLQVVGPVFQPEKYGIAVPQHSPLRERVDEALLAMYADGTYEDIHSRWFAPGH